MADLTHWKETWPVRKRRWCCVHESIACGSGPEKYGPFHCEAGLSNWHRLWSPQKQAWCCLKERIACPGLQDDWGRQPTETATTTSPWTTTASVTEHPPVNATAAKLLAKQVLSHGFDCLTNIDREAVWTLQQKNWCCAYTDGQVGCVDQAAASPLHKLQRKFLARLPGLPERRPVHLGVAGAALLAVAGAAALAWARVRGGEEPPEGRREQDALLEE